MLGCLRLGSYIRECWRVEDGNVGVLRMVDVEDGGYFEEEGNVNVELCRTLFAHYNKNTNLPYNHFLWFQICTMRSSSVFRALPAVRSALVWCSVVTAPRVRA